MADTTSSGTVGRLVVVAVVPGVIGVDVAVVDVIPVIVVDVVDVTGHWPLSPTPSACDTSAVPTFVLTLTFACPRGVFLWRVNVALPSPIWSAVQRVTRAFFPATFTWPFF